MSFAESRSRSFVSRKVVSLICARIQYLNSSSRCLIASGRIWLIWTSCPYAFSIRCKNLSMASVFSIGVPNTCSRSCFLMMDSSSFQNWMSSFCHSFMPSGGCRLASTDVAKYPTGDPLMASPSRLKRWTLSALIWSTYRSLSSSTAAIDGPYLFVFVVHACMKAGFKRYPMSLEPSWRWK